MDELYKVGEKVAQETSADFAGAGLQDLLGDDVDIEQYLQGYEQMLQQGFNPEHVGLNKIDAEGGVTVRPDPGFVVKTRDKGSGMKVFLNVVSNEYIEKPHIKSFTELEGEEGVRVPLSVGTPVEDFDKKKEPCVTYDIVANPEVVEECGQTPSFRDTVIQLCLSAIAQKYKVELEEKYKIPKMTYKGDQVQLQRIRVKNQSKIQEVNSSAPMPGSSAAEREKAASEAKDANGRQKQPEFCVFYAKSGLPPIDGFARDWGLLADECTSFEELDYFCGFDLPFYRLNAFQERIRGTMMNKKAQEQRQELEQEVGSTAQQVERDTHEQLSGRTCVVQVRMPDLDPSVASLKQFGVEVSEECLRATAEWDTNADTLTVSLPTEQAPTEGAAAFDENLLDAVF